MEIANLLSVCMYLLLLSPVQILRPHLIRPNLANEFFFICFLLGSGADARPQPLFGGLRASEFGALGGGVRGHQPGLQGGDLGRGRRGRHVI